MVNKNREVVKLVLACSMAAVTAISAQLKFNISFIPYTMQNFSVILSGFLLGPVYGAISQLIYIAMIAVGFRVASGLSGGLGILFGPTAGYIWAFPIAAFIAGIFRKLIWRKGRKHEMLLLWISSFIAAIPIYLLGFVVFYHFTTINANLMRWSEMAAGLLGLNLDPFTTVFVASVLLFVPQDFFVDQLLAVYVFRYVEEMIRQRGFEI